MNDYNPLLFQRAKAGKAPAWNRTRDGGFKVHSDSHYTTRALLYTLIKMFVK